MFSIKKDLQRYNNGLSGKNESVQCNAALAITGAFRETSREKLFL